MGQAGRSSMCPFMLAVVLLAGGLLQEAIAIQTYTVGEKFGWNPSPPFSYDQWATHGKNMQVGDDLLFSFTAGKHNVLKVTEANLGSCNASDPISSSGADPAIIQLTSAGYHGFISGFPGDCANGMHMSIWIPSSSGPGGAEKPPESSPGSSPSSSSSPGTGILPAGSATPTGSPFPSGAAPSSPSIGPPPDGTPTPSPKSSPSRSVPSPGPASPPPAGSHPRVGISPGPAPEIGSIPTSNAPVSSPGAAAPTLPAGSPQESAPSPGPASAGPTAPPTPFRSRLSSPELSPPSPAPAPTTANIPSNNLILPPLLSPGGSLGDAKSSAGRHGRHLGWMGSVIPLVLVLFLDF